MTKAEEFLTKIGECAFMEVDEIANIEYAKNKEGVFSQFIITTTDGARFAIEIKQIAVGA